MSKKVKVKKEGILSSEEALKIAKDNSYASYRLELIMGRIESASHAGKTNTTIYLIGPDSMSIDTLQEVVDELEELGYIIQISSGNSSMYIDWSK